MITIFMCLSTPYQHLIEAEVGALIIFLMVLIWIFTVLFCGHQFLLRSLVIWLYLVLASFKPQQSFLWRP